MNKLLAFILIFLGINIGYSQKTITGTVNDNKGQPIVGANVTEKGTSSGTTTDFEGKFKINVSNTNATIVITSLGYKKKEVSASLSPIVVSLEEDGVLLDEVAVQAVGSRNTKRTIIDSPVAVDIINIAIRH